MLDAHRALADRLLRPLAERLRTVDPNRLTWLGFLMAVAAGFAFYFAKGPFLLLAIAFVFLNALFDALDGRVAKLTGRASRRGDFLDHVLDRYADVIMIGGVALGGYGNLLIGLFGILGVLLASYMGTQAQALGLGRDYSGLMGRADRIVLLWGAAWAQLFLDPRGVGGGPLLYTPLTLALIVFAVLGQITAIQRGVSAWRRMGGG